MGPLSAGCDGATSPTEEDTPPLLPAGEHRIELVHGGRNRFALLHVPPQAHSGEPLPLVLALHGGGGHPEHFRDTSGLSHEADREGFLVLYPAGTGFLPDRLLTWNASPECCGSARDHGVDDVGFLLALVDEVSRRTRVAEWSVFLTGHSNGAMLALRVAEEAPDRIRAVVSVGGVRTADPSPPPTPVPLLLIHSLDDAHAPYEGGKGLPFPGTEGPGINHVPVGVTLDAWRRANGCPLSPRIVEVREGTPGTPDAGQQAERLVWEECSGAPLEHWRLTGVGHGWPGAPPGVLDLGPTTTLLRAAEEGWAFFARVRALQP